MKSSSDTICYLPNEILFFKRVTSIKKDPIKKYMFSLEELNYIVKRISRFSVCSSSFSRVYSLNDNKKLLRFLCSSYLGEHIISSRYYCDIKQFISIFFDYSNPVYNDDSYDKSWIYPRMDINNFINDSLFEYKRNNVYFDSSTLSKLISIFTSFTKYEYSYCDDDIPSMFEGLNYPSLILANISLYEKGYLEVVEDLNEIQIFFRFFMKFSYINFRFF